MLPQPGSWLHKAALPPAPALADSQAESSMCKFVLTARVSTSSFAASAQAPTIHEGVQGVLRILCRQLSCLH